MNVKNAIRIEESVLQVLDAAEIDGNRLVLRGQLDRKLYEQTNKVLVAAGGKWDRRAKAHLFDVAASEVIEPIILTGTYSRTKQDFGQFDTPPPLAQKAVALAGIVSGMSCYEPSAGVGNIVAAMIEATGSGANIFGNEIDPKRHAQCVSRNFLAFGTRGLSMEDFLMIDPPRWDLPGFDRIVMNPPFSGQSDVRHVLHAAKFLNRGGKLVSIMSAGIMFRSNRLTEDFRAFVAERGGSIERLPDEAFKASGTSVNTCIVSLFA